MPRCVLSAFLYASRDLIVCPSCHKTAEFYPPRPLSPPHALKDLNEENRRLYPDIAAQMDANKRKEEEEAVFASKCSKSRNEASLLSPKEENIVARGVSASSFSPGSAPTSASGVDTRHPRIERAPGRIQQSPRQIQQPPHLIQQLPHPIKQQGRPNLGLIIPPETNLDDLITSPHVPLTPRQLYALSQFVQHASVRPPSNIELRSPVERTCDPRKRTMDPRKRPRLSKDSQYIVDEAQTRAKLQNMMISSPQAMSKASSNRCVPSSLLFSQTHLKKFTFHLYLVDNCRSLSRPRCHRARNRESDLATEKTTIDLARLRYWGTHRRFQDEAHVRTQVQVEAQARRQGPRGSSALLFPSRRSPRPPRLPNHLAHPSRERFLPVTSENPRDLEGGRCPSYESTVAE